MITEIKTYVVGLIKSLQTADPTLEQIPDDRIYEKAYEQERYEINPWASVLSSTASVSTTRRDQCAILEITQPVEVSFGCELETQTNKWINAFIAAVKAWVNLSVSSVWTRFDITIESIDYGDKDSFWDKSYGVIRINFEYIMKTGG